MVELAVKKSSFQRAAAAELLFYIGYIIWMIWKLIGISMFSFAEGSLANTAFHIVSLGFLVVAALLSFKPDKEALIAICFLALGLAVKFCSDSVALIDLVCLLYASKSTNFERIAKLTLVLLGCGIAVIVGSSLIGIIPDYLFPRGNELNRHGLGFRYPTNITHLYLNIVLLYLWLRKDKMLGIEYLILFVIDIVLFLLTDSRNSCGLVVVALLLGVLLRYCDTSRFDCVLRALAQYSFVVFTLISLILALIYSPSSSFLSALNDVSSNRIAQDNASIYKYGVTPFGQDIEWSNRVIQMGSDISEREADPSGDTNIVESSFLNILINHGLVALFAVLIVLFIAAKNNRDPWLSMVLFVIACHSALDFQLINLLYTTFLFLIWWEFLGTQEGAL